MDRNETLGLCATATKIDANFCLEVYKHLDQQKKYGICRLKHQMLVVAV